MMYNNEYAQTSKPQLTDNAAASKSSVIETNGFNNNLIDTITRNSESNGECNDYSSFEDLLNIDNFITMENKDDADECNRYRNVDASFVNADFGVNSSVSFTPGDDNILDSISKGYITDSNESTSSSINLNRENLSAMSTTGVDDQSDGSINTSANRTNNNLNASPSSEPDYIANAGSETDGQCVSIDSDTNFLKAKLPITNFEASSSSIPNLNTIEQSNDTPTAPVTESTITPRKKHFPNFINLYCAKCGESPWTPRYYSDKKCQTCENNVTLRCWKCKQESDKYENMAYHLKTKCAPNDVRYKCSQCNYHTFVRSSLKHHMKAHEPSNNIKCRDCGVSVLKNKKSLENHKRYYCPKRKQEGHMKCLNCNRRYKSEMCLRKHEKNCIYTRGRGDEEKHLDEGSSHGNT